MKERFFYGIVAAFLLAPLSLQAETTGVLQFQKPEAAQDVFGQEESVQLEEELLNDYAAVLLSSKSFTEFVKEAGNFTTQAGRYLTVVDRLLSQRYQILGSLDQTLIEIDRFLEDASHEEIEAQLAEASAALQRIEQEVRNYKEKFTNGALSRRDRQLIRLLRQQHQLESSRRNLLASRLAGKKASAEALARFREDLRAFREGVEGVFEALHAHRNAVAVVATDVRRELTFLVENGSSLARLQNLPKKLAEVFPLAKDLEEQTRGVMEAVPHLGTLLPDLTPDLGMDSKDDDDLAAFFGNF
jgi:hypothetical protein